MKDSAESAGIVIEVNFRSSRAGSLALLGRTGNAGAFTESSKHKGQDEKSCTALLGHLSEGDKAMKFRSRNILGLLGSVLNYANQTKAHAR